MSTEILFARHGNTFSPGEKVVWVGRETDLPLVEKGRAQALAAAQSLRRAALVPDVIYAATLQRTRQFAEIVAHELSLSNPEPDHRLDEVHYGTWAGRTNEEIAAMGDHAKRAMEGWNTADLWPEEAGWESRKADILAGLSEFIAERLDRRGDQRVLVVSSNGILRFLPRMVQSLGAGTVPRASYKMATGHLGLLVDGPEGRHIAAWDQSPEIFPSKV